MVPNRRLIALIILTLIISKPLWASPISQADAVKAVEGWLQTDNAPMGAQLGSEIAWTDAYTDANGLCAYYIVYCKPSGFVIVAADDLVEPIVGFVAGYSYYDPSPENVLGALVDRDLASRVVAAKKVQIDLNNHLQRSRFTSRQLSSQIHGLQAKIKWRRLRASATPVTTRTLSVSDVRVPPLLASTWGQDNVNGTYCYNYYTPNHYYDGCVATAMAQFMRFWQWPAAGIGTGTYRIYVGNIAQNATTRGGDGLGGAYNWSQMMLSPGASITTTQRQAIGTLCYDAGVAVHMQYDASGSGAYMHDTKNALVTTFMYSNAVMGGNEYSGIGTGLNDMINPNLDSGNPVLLAIYQYNNGQYGAGHAIVSDGYGYNSSTLYHHLNLGWDGDADAWYNLPTVDTGYYTFNTVVGCIYNIYTSGSGEIISGRITESSGLPISGAAITADGPGGPYTATSNGNGIYALVKVHPNATYAISVATPGYSFEPKMVTTGASLDGQLTAGNKSGIDFADVSAMPAPPLSPASISYPASSATGKYTISWSASEGATSYQLERSGNRGRTWTLVYSASDLLYYETIGGGKYRYRVNAVNSGGSSAYKTGTNDCVVAYSGHGSRLDRLSRLQRHR